MDHTCEATVVACIDFRFWQKLIDYLASNEGLTKYDLICLAGGARNVAEEETREIVFRQLDISTQKHKASKVYLVNHFDCGAYGGSAAFESKDEERRKLSEDLVKAAKVIREKYPQLLVEQRLMDFGQIYKLADN